MKIEPFSASATESTLAGLLDRWIAINLEERAAELEWGREHGANFPEGVEENGRTIIFGMAQKAKPHLAAFLRDNSDRTAEQLEEVANCLSPGGAHTGGLLARLIWENVWLADPLLLAATVWFNWHGGKAGFQFLPDPAKTEVDAYEEEAWRLIDLFDSAFDGDPRRILTGADRAFFDSLPDRFTVYRGCAGISPEQAAAGVCWATQRDVAEWFACRSARIVDATPILVSARISKADVRLAKASEFEVVAIPRSFRTLSCRLRKRADWRPVMEWTAAGVEFANGDAPGVRLRP